LGDRDPEDIGSRPAQAKTQDTIQKIRVNLAKIYY
jgi:hypothetical protein